MRDHLGVFGRLLALPTPSGDPLGSSLRENGPEVDQKSSIAVTIIEIREKPQLLFAGKDAPLLGACLHQFLEHFTDLPIGKSEATDEELSGE